MCLILGMTQLKIKKLSWLAEKLCERMTGYNQASMATRVQERFRLLNLVPAKPRRMPTSPIYIDGSSAILLTLSMVAYSHGLRRSFGVDGLLRQVVAQCGVEVFIDANNLILQLAFDNTNTCCGAALSRHFEITGNPVTSLLEIHLDKYISHFAELVEQ